MQKWLIFWSPEGRPIKEVEAKSGDDALRKTPMPYRKFMGEVYAQTTKKYIQEHGREPKIFN